jgi:hypothetical protein
MQYLQRRLQRSVTDSRKLRNGRPKVSFTVGIDCFSDTGSLMPRMFLYGG